MKSSNSSFTLAITLLLALGTFSGCESTDSSRTTVSSNVYYGVGFYDPWYYGDYDHDHDVIVTPPDRPDRPDRPERPPQVEHPIARPPASPSRPPAASHQPAARPMPSIPSTPRAAPRGGGGGRR